LQTKSSGRAFFGSAAAGNGNGNSAVDLEATARIGISACSAAAPLSV
jgi:hypothetical protein